jgi:hypothetical protein
MPDRVGKEILPAYHGFIEGGAESIEVFPNDGIIA